MSDHDVLSITNAINLCRIVWWDGNPLAQETIPGVRFKLESSVLRRDGEAGRVGFLNAISANVGSKG